MKKISKSVIKKVNEDEFAKSVLKYYTASRKLKKKDIEPCITTATIAVISRGTRMDAKALENKVKSAKPFVFRVASLLSPAIGLHEKLLSDERPEGLFLPDQDVSFTKYIG